MKKTPDFDGAAAFMAGHARVVDRRLFQRLFSGGAAGAVRDAVAAYRNADGGFGFALEPDCRSAASQPAAVEMALRLLDFADEWDAALVTDAVDWLATVAPAEGGAAFVEPSVTEGPHAPWWVPEEGHPASLIQTGQIAGVLYARGFAHPWLDRATEVMWSRIETLIAPSGYEMFGVLAFLRARAGPGARHGGVLAGRGRCCCRAGWSRSTRRPGGEVHSPLDFAPLPSSLARGLFSEAVIEAHLDHLAGGAARRRRLDVQLAVLVARGRGRLAWLPDRRCPACCSVPTGAPEAPLGSADGRCWYHWGLLGI